jgi:hypothetical protein
MADIGSTLRETRIRDKIDITTVEEQTKIRAKYLRALENEEWAVMPGPTYVKSFLRTYAEFLGLDAHMLVEEYRARYEPPEELEVPAFTQGRPLRGRVRPPGPPSRGVAVAAVVLGFLALLFVLGITGGDENGGERAPEQSRGGGAAGGERKAGGSEDRTESADRRRERAERREAERELALSVVATRSVWVCLVNARGRPLIAGRTLATGEREGPFRSKRFRITLGNGGGDLRIDGKLRDVPDSAVPIGFAIGPNGTRRLAETGRPTCEPGADQGAGAADL